MGPERVVITGLGVVSSIGIGKAAFTEAIFRGGCGIKPISLFDTAALSAKLAGEIGDFRAEDFLGQKGIRTLDRSTRLLASAAKLALDDANLKPGQENAADIGAAVGSSLGSLSSISDFDREAQKDGPRYVNPALFPNTVINSPASQMAIRFNLKAFNATISCGFPASLDAIGNATEFLRLRRAKAVLAGGVEELCIQAFIGFYKAGCLAGTAEGSLEISCPFDKRRNGLIFGEGAAILCLENLASARERSAKIYAEVAGFAAGFGQGGLSRTMRSALNQAQLAPSEIDYVSAAANSTQHADLLETKALKEVFGSGAGKVRISAIKSVLGECFSASGSLQALAAVPAMEKGMVPPTINYREKDPDCDLNYVVNQAQSAKVDNVLINAFAPDSFSSSLVISKFKDE